MKKLKIFNVWLTTKFGLGTFKIKAKNFEDAFSRLGKKDKMKDGWIESEEGESVNFCELRQNL